MQALFDWITQFFSTGIYDFATAALASLIEWLLLLKLQWMLWLLQFAWGIAQTLITNLGISEALRTAWNNLDSEVLSMLMFFRVPDAINLILGGFGTRFVLRFLPVGV